MRASVIIVPLLLSLFLSCQTGPPYEEGPWRAWLDSPGGELPFGLEIDGREGVLRAWLANGDERVPVEQVVWDGDGFTFSINRYDARITARVSQGGTRLDGEWVRRSRGLDEWARMPFHATAGAAPRFSPDPGATAGLPDAIDGRWAVDFESDDLPAVGEFHPGPDGTVTGTFLTATGDYRYLAGRVDAGRLRLSSFDGSHAFLFDARLGEDGTLAGDFWSRESWHETWTARRDPEAALPDPFDLALWAEDADLAELVFPDLDGQPRSLADPVFAGRARLIHVFGSWCPNCNDATRLMVELHDRYRARGLSIVGLAFEHTGDFERDAAQVRYYARHHGVAYPLLVAGVSDREKAREALPALQGVRAYPTTIFLHGDGRVRAVHTGFAGPATGAAHDRLRERFESLIEELLDEGA